MFQGNQGNAQPSSPACRRSNRHLRSSVRLRTNAGIALPGISKRLLALCNLGNEGAGGNAPSGPWIELSLFPLLRTNQASAPSATRCVPQLGLFVRCQVKRSSKRELLLRLFFVSRITQRLAPFEVQPSPIGRVFVGFFELRQREVRAVLRHQSFAPTFQRIGEARALLIREPKLG